MSSRRALLLLSALLSTLLVAAPASAQTFGDVGGNGVHAVSISALAGDGIVDGCGGGDFCPDRGLTRAQVASLLDRALDLQPNGEAPSFSDTAGSVHEPAIQRIAAAGVTEGYGDGTFLPNEYISRGQLASLLARALDLPSAPSGTVFNDTAGAHEANIAALAHHGIAAGCDLVSFCPAQRLTRAQGATFVARALNLVDRVSLASFTERQAEHETVRPASTAPGARAVEVALAQVGKPYQWGGNGPNSFDCSGLTRFAWNQAGVNLPRVSRDQYSGTQRISRSDLQPGDLIFYYSPISHVAMYIGDGRVVEAPYSGNTVRVSSSGLSRSGIVGYGRPR